MLYAQIWNLDDCYVMDYVHYVMMSMEAVT